MEIKITKLKREKLNEVIKIASGNFSGMKDIKKAQKWVRCNFLAYPRMQYFVAKSKNQILGYILWVEKGGFRKNSVWELEQVAVGKNFQGQGIGTKLIKGSLLEIQKYLKRRKSKLKLIEVTTGTENKAQKLYQKALNAKVEARIKDLFRGDEVIMIARNIKIVDKRDL